MTPEEFLKLWLDAGNETPDGFTEVNSSGWTQDYKDQQSTTTYRCDTAGKFFEVVESRSGSYHTDWYYDEPDCYEVTPQTQTTTVYVAVA